MLYRQAKTLLLLMLLMMVVPSVAQQTTITGVVTDAETGESIGYASVVYKGHKIAVVSGTGDVDLNKFHKNHGLNEIKMPKKK